MPTAHAIPDGHSAGRITLAELQEAIRNGSTDTVIVAITDMQGRLMGKRVTGQFFSRPRSARHPLLHVSARHRHGDEHARRVSPDELGNGLR